MRKNTLLYLLTGVLTLLCIFLFAYTVNPKLDLNGDNASYIRLARIMAEGHGYSDIGLDGTYYPASHFPPGYPALLSVFVRMGIDSLMGLKILNCVFLCLSVLGLFLLTRKLTGQQYWAFSIAAMTLFSYSLLHFAGMVMSETLYMFLTVVSAYALYRYSDERKIKWYASPWFYVAILSAAASYHVRTIGLAAMFAVVVFFLFRKEWWASLGSAAGLFLCLLPWALRNAAYGIKGRYMGTIMTVNPWRPEMGEISTVGEMVDKMVVNLNDTVVQGFKSLLFPFAKFSDTGFGAVLLGLLVVAVVFWGAWNMGRMRWYMLAFLLANMGLFALWHGGNGTRYVTPLIPFLFVFFYTGILSFWRLWRKKRKKPEMKVDSLWGLLWLLMLIPMSGPVKTLHKEVNRSYPAAYSNYFNLAVMVNNSVEEGTVVCCRKPEFFAHFAPKTRSANYLYSLQQEEVVRDLLGKKVDYVVLDQLGYSSTGRYLYPAILKYPQFFKEIYRTPEPITVLYAFDRRAVQENFFTEE